HRGGVSMVATCALMATVRRRRHEAMRQRTPAKDDRRPRRWMAASMDRVNVAIQGTDDLEQMMSDMLDAALSIFDCDRAELVYPCDPDARAQIARMQRTRPGCPGPFEVGVEVPMDAETAAVLRIVKASGDPVGFGPGCDRPLSAGMAQQLGVQ